MVSPIQKQQDIIITVYQKTLQSTVWGYKVSNKSSDVAIAVEYHIWKAVGEQRAIARKVTLP